MRSPSRRKQARRSEPHEPSTTGLSRSWPGPNAPPAKPKYLALVRKFPLRLIQSEEENDQRKAVLENRSAIASEEDLAGEEHDYIAVLAKLIEGLVSRYPRVRRCSPTFTGGISRQRASFRVPTGLAESTISQLLRGRRKLSRQLISTFAQYFRVEPVLFADE